MAADTAITTTITEANRMRAITSTITAVTTDTTTIASSLFRICRYRAIFDYIEGYHNAIRLYWTALFYTMGLLPDTHNCGLRMRR